MSTSSIVIAEIVDLVERVATLNLGYLSVSVVILALLGGAFYLFNIRPLKETLDRQEKVLTDLKEEVEENLSSSKNELKGDLKNFEEKHTKNISFLIGQKNEKLISDIQTRIVTFEKEFSEKIDVVAGKKDSNLKKVLLSDVGDQLRTLEKSLSTEINNTKIALEKKISSVETIHASLDEYIKDLKRRVKELGVYKYSKEGQMGAIYGLIELLGEDISEDSWQIEDTLENLEKEIKGVKLDASARYPFFKTPCLQVF